MPYMSNEEILRRFKACGEDDKAIKIVAELNGCKSKEIREIVNKMLNNNESNKSMVLDSKVSKNNNVEKSNVEKSNVEKSNVKKSRTVWSDDIKEKIKQCIIEGLPFDEIADKYNLDKSGSGAKQVYFKLKRKLKEDGIEIKRAPVKRHSVSSLNEGGTSISDESKVLTTKQETTNLNKEDDSVKRDTGDTRREETEVISSDNTTKEYNNLHSKSSFEYEFSSIIDSLNKHKNELEKLKAQYIERISELQLQVNKIDLDIKQDDIIIGTIIAREKR